MTVRAFAQYAAIVSAAGIAAVIAAEFYLASRAAAPPAIPFYNRLYPYVMFRPYENVSWVSDEPQAMSHHKSRVYVYTNTDGFRVPSAGYELPKAKPAGQLRIAFLCASAVQLGSTFDVTLPGALRIRLRSMYLGADIEVINAGVQSCVSRQSIAQLLFTVAGYQPDIVILYDGVNDLGLPMTYESRPNFPYNFQAMEEAWDNYREGRRDSVWGLLAARSHVLRVIRERLGVTLHEALPARQTARSPYIGRNAVTADKVLQDPLFVRNHAASYLENWRMLVELSRVYRFRPVCILQPTGILDAGYSLPVLMDFYNLDRGPAERWISAFGRLYVETERQIGLLRKDYPDALFLDLHRAVAPASGQFWDLAHVYDEVNSKLAERISQDLRPLLDERTARPR